MKMRNFIALAFLCFISIFGLSMAGGYGGYGHSRSYGYETHQVHPSHGYGHYGHGPSGGYSHRYEHRIVPHHYGPQYVSTGLKYTIGGHGGHGGYGYGHGFY